MAATGPISAPEAMAAAVAPRALARGQIRRWSPRLILADIGALIAATVSAAGIAWLVPTPRLPYIWALALIVATPALAAARGAYSSRSHLDYVELLFSLLGQLTLAGLFVFAAWAITASDTFASEPLIVTWATSAALLAGVRIALHTREVRSSHRYSSLHPTLIVGAGRVGKSVARRLLTYPEFGLLPIGYLDDDPLIPRGSDVPVLGNIADLDRVVEQYGIAQVIITFSLATHEQLLTLIERAAALNLDVSLVPRLYEKTSARVAVWHLGRLPLLDLTHCNTTSPQFRVKYALDKVGAALALALVAPILLVSMATVWLTMGRPIFFRQTRVGRDGNEFEMLKLRTMRPTDGDEIVDLPPDTAPGGVEGGVDRMTAVGRRLRRLSVDELPQLLNVLHGEMSLVGPRPERPEFVRRFATDVKGYKERHRVKAGITGWAQVHGLRGQTSISDRAEWDNYYIDNFSLWLDAKILLLTIGALLGEPRQSRS